MEYLPRKHRVAKRVLVLKPRLQARNMKFATFFIFIALLVLYSEHSAADQKIEIISAINCGDASSVGEATRMILHKSAQNRAQTAIESSFGKVLTKPYSTKKDIK